MAPSSTRKNCSRRSRIRLELLLREARVREVSDEDVGFWWLAWVMNVLEDRSFFVFSNPD
jgi:hypothetical protein